MKLALPTSNLLFGPGSVAHPFLKLISTAVPNAVFYKRSDSITQLVQSELKPEVENRFEMFNSLSFLSALGVAFRFFSTAALRVFGVALRVFGAGLRVFGAGLRQRHSIALCKMFRGTARPRSVMFHRQE